MHTFFSISDKINVKISETIVYTIIVKNKYHYMIEFCRKTEKKTLMFTLLHSH